MAIGFTFERLFLWFEMRKQDNSLKRTGCMQKGMYAASPVAANGHIYFASRRGLVTVMKTDDSFEKVCALQLDGEIYATPAIQNDLIFFRTTKWLYAFQ